MLADLLTSYLPLIQNIKSSLPVGYFMSGNEVGRVISKLKRYVPLDYNYENRVLPGTRGLYSFWLRGCCIYVGKSLNISNRLREHRRDEANKELAAHFRAFREEIDVSYVDLEDITDELLSQIEVDVIRSMKPKDNKTHQS